jgi:hypothetical protein
MTPLELHPFVVLRRDIESHPRLSGYYIVKLVSISDLRAQHRTDEEIAEEVFRQFDDQTWPPVEQRPIDQVWADYATDRTTARNRTIEHLMGGPPFGHLNVTISESRAAEYFERFDAMFSEPKAYYVDLGFGDLKNHVFSGGVAIISSDMAGCLWVVEND